MIQKDERPSRGRPLKNENQPLDQKSIRLTSAQWGKIAANGGVEWLRALIDGDTPAPAAAATGFDWRMTPHVCRMCFGRVLVRQDREHGGLIFRCASCGNEGHGDAPAVICACGFKLEGTKDMGVRCHVNPERTPDSIDEIVATVHPEQPVTKLEWVKWTDPDGKGIPPVEAGAAIAYRSHAGKVLTTDYPHFLNWFHGGELDDIVEYRLLTLAEVDSMPPWVEWTGGECPVDHASTVQVRLGNYGQNGAVPAGPQNWKHSPKGTNIWDLNIIAYRVVTA